MLIRTNAEIHVSKGDDFKVEKTPCMVIISIGSHRMILSDYISGSDWIAKSIVDQLTPPIKAVPLPSGHPEACPNDECASDCETCGGTGRLSAEGQAEFWKKRYADYGCSLMRAKARVVELHDALKELSRVSCYGAFEPEHQAAWSSVHAILAAK